MRNAASLVSLHYALRITLTAMAAHTAHGSDEAQGRAIPARTVVRALHDPAVIRTLLEPERVFAAYGIAQLAPRLFPQVHCYYAEREDGEGLVLHSAGGLGDAMLTAGNPAAVEAILRLHRGPRQNFATCALDHLGVLERYFRIAQQTEMARMLVTEASFEPAPAITDGHVRIARLHSAHARAINRLYNTEGAPTFYSANHIENGYYHGIYYDGRLVAVAGTHVVSPEEGVAVVGNVFTHPRYRGRGYATLATGAVTAALLKHCRDAPGHLRSRRGGEASPRPLAWPRAGCGDS
jgi:hypothetical protein